uniref:Uncharacterized protein n=1 Tax=Anguilla anguilla TaxID=7936 RepID=A0A0E9TQZ6_ANGAN
MGYCSSPPRGYKHLLFNHSVTP